MHTETLLSLCVSVQPEKREQPTGKGWSVMSSCNVFWNAIVVLYIPASSNDDMSVVLYQLLYLIFHISLSHVFFNQSFKNCLNPTTSTPFKPKVKKTYVSDIQEVYGGNTGWSDLSDALMDVLYRKDVYLERSKSTQVHRSVRSPWCLLGPLHGVLIFHRWLCYIVLMWCDCNSSVRIQDSYIAKLLCLA